MLYTSVLSTPISAQVQNSAIESIASIEPIARMIAASGGRAIVVGGWVRDRLLGYDAKDIDIEVHDLPLERLEAVLGRFGEVITIGRAFGVLRVKGLDVDFSLPRRDSKIGTGHRGFRIAFDPGLDFEAASLRRDLTINSMGFDPITREILDPHGGRTDLKAGVLRATCPERFSEDPLRGVRVAQFAARFGMTADPGLKRLMAGLDLGELSAERLFTELEKLLLKGKRPSVGFGLLRETGLIRFFPEAEALIGIPQDKEWHPEGDVWTHTLLVLDEAAGLRDGGEDDPVLMFGALCHDFGKPETTVQENGRIKSHGHNVAGLVHTARFLGRLRASDKWLVRPVKALVEHHLAPALLVKQGATHKAYRRLARKLEEANVSMELLTRLASADHFGRTAPDALERLFPAGETFLHTARTLSLEQQGPRDRVLGRHLIARGLQPGAHFRDILMRCREIQDETGWSDPDRILDCVLE
uniref:tRNA nucleotidyltransferase (CCA-adding enzyme) n=1 Tax=Candidatus Kentrum sp. FM TaxID=2126340 RepID=A0A450W0B8_9GAMM|nr:MAG: tRNA nucleotidyltransferase (CCA-adding enzyme) [Candidatus Kentron sp. FM]VFJ49742.1 MAG: tRNA nucleotidyltransferase (CCA-adding enzyme) [Candidatus Kentron sp. FM]VFK10493.1 MAG: tRNA nucleotidyltransferase (CCA-adding enzyme) [Candidatus Kentron sp. FM]